jgi:hypothetical protein
MQTCFVGFLILTGLASGDEQFRAPSIPTPLQPLTAEDYEPAARLAQEAMDRLKEDGFSGFMSEAFSGRSGSLRKSDRAQCEKQLDKIYRLMVARHGRTLDDIELVRTSTISRSVLRFTYMMKFERGPILWTLDFYRGEHGMWRWLSFNVGDDRIDQEFRPGNPSSDANVAASLARKGIEAIKDGGVSDLLDVVTESERTVISMDRDAFEAKFNALHRQATSALGKPLGEFDLIRTDVLGDSLVRFVYLERYEFGAIVWKFSFYDVSGQWMWFGLGLNELGYELSGK